MNTIGPWITNLFIVFAVVFATGVDAASKRGVKAVILYAYDDNTIGSNVVSMEVDKSKLMSLIKDSQFQSKSAKPLKFGEDNGFFALLEGESSAFSFATESGMADCDCKCKKVLTTTTTTTTTTPRPTTTTTTRRPTTTQVLRTPAPTYLPSGCTNGGSGPHCCLNGADNKDCCGNGGSGPDCCLNGGRGEFCCTNGATNIDCCQNGGTGPFCCTNGGSGKYCCPNGLNEPDCGEYVPPATTPSPRPPIIVECPNGGKGQYCCTNGANNPGCELTVITTTRPIITTTRPVITTSRPIITTTPYRPTISITKKKTFQGPLYLPQSTVKTTRVPYATQTYTFGSRPTNTYRYTWSYGPWSGPSRGPTVSYTTTTTPKYNYEGDGSIQFNGADGNGL